MKTVLMMKMKMKKMDFVSVQKYLVIHNVVPLKKENAISIVVAVNQTAFAIVIVVCIIVLIVIVQLLYFAYVVADNDYNIIKNKYIK